MTQPHHFVLLPPSLTDFCPSSSPFRPIQTDATKSAGRILETLLFFPLPAGLDEVIPFDINGGSSCFLSIRALYTTQGGGGSRPPSVSLCIVWYYTSPQRRRWRRRGKKKYFLLLLFRNLHVCTWGIVWRGRGLWKGQRMERRRGRFASLADVSREKIQEKKVAEGGGREGG